ncbi:MAG TPA: helix-turn-helix domain-containing protein [Longimicrobiales bacterium]|nr:helix-turn-helix domain-containing protein [Longimicrobiales bacterium]
MTATGWRQRLLASTRGRVLALLRWGPRTVADLAEALGVTHNAVRLHVGSLERDGLIEQGGVRRGPRKPAHVYRLTPEADAVFPKGYAAVLLEVLGHIREERGEEGLEELLRAVGRRAGERARPGSADLRARLDAAVALLGELGGLARVEESEDAIVIRGFSCPFESIVGENPEACALAEELVGGIVGAEVRECCDRTGAPRCAFRVGVVPEPRAAS